MAAANTADFFGEGTADQGTAAPLSLAEQSRLQDNARQRKLEEDRLRRLPGSNAYQATRGAADQSATDLSNSIVQEDRIARGFDPFKGDQRGIFAHLKEDPVTTGILLAPYGVAAAGALAAPAAGGVGSIATPAGASPYVGAAAGVPAMGTPAMMASPFAASAAPAAGAALPGAAAIPGAASAAPAAGWTTKDYLQTFLPLASSLGLAGLDEWLHGGQSEADKALLQKQEQMAREAELRREQTNNARMDALGQRMLAYNPHNQLMAQMFGPQAAFAPTDFANMVHNPMEPQLDPALQGYTGDDQEKLGQIRDYNANSQRYASAEEQRRNQMLSGMSPVPQGPAPMQMAAPQAARRY
jgi:hypothetical protein